MSEILLENFLQLCKKYHNRVKVRFNQYNGYDDPMELYKSNPIEVNNTWLFWRTKTRNFNVGDIAVCFLKIAQNRWLLTTIKKVVNEFDINNGVNYEGVELEEYKPYFGRIIVTYHKDHQAQCCYYENIQEKFVINQILPDVFDGEDFPGYDNVKLSYWQLHTIINAHKKDWVAALQNQKAVYLITDTNNGKLYVGSATSDNGMLLSRWNNYISNGHGGNKGLIELIEKEGFEYVKKHFQYSILENYNAKIDDKIVLSRESHWKEVLHSREFGYNQN